MNIFQSGEYIDNMRLLFSVMHFASKPHRKFIGTPDIKTLTLKINIHILFFYLFYLIFEFSSFPREKNYNQFEWNFCTHKSRYIFCCCWPYIPLFSMRLMYTSVPTIYLLHRLGKSKVWLTSYKFLLHMRFYLWVIK